MADIERAYGQACGKLTSWVSRKPERDARVWQARSATAWRLAEEGLNGIEVAMTPFELQKAGMVQQAKKWQASVLDRRLSDKQRIEHLGLIGAIDASQALTPEQMRHLAKTIVENAGESGEVQ